MATPDPFSPAVASVVVPSRKFTAPVGTVVLPEGPATVAVNVTDCPAVDGLADEVTVVVDAALAAFTTWLTTFDVDPVKFVSPP